MSRTPREARFTSEWQKWFRAGKDNGVLPNAAVLEVKSAEKGEAISFSAVSEKQIHSLMVAKWYSFVHKWSDYDRLGTPTDLMYIRKGAGLVIYSYGKDFFIIDIDVFINEKETSKRKSLTEDRAREIAMLTGTLA